MADLQVQRAERFLKGLTLGAARSMMDAQDRAAKDGLIEREEQFQIKVGGRAEEFLSWDTVDIKFGTVFVDATGQRDSEFDRPHFTYGAQIDSPIPVGLLACVLQWKTTDRNETVGCKLAIGVAATDQGTTFHGFLHATFQGFGQPLTTFNPEDLGTG